MRYWQPSRQAHRAAALQIALRAGPVVTEHLKIEAHRANFHVIRAGEGLPPPLLHGWPEFSLAWEEIMHRLAGRYTVLAPDLRGFGERDKPIGPFGPDEHGSDMLALLDALGVERAGLVGHGVGGAVMMAMARPSAVADQRTILL